MKSRPVALTIVWWIETIISIRVLLFTIPVIMSKNSAQAFDLNSMNDRFIAVMTVVAVVYAFVGILSILGSTAAKLLHYLAVIVAFAVNIGSLYAFEATAAPAGIKFFAPAIFATVFLAFTVVLGAKKQS